TDQGVEFELIEINGKKIESSEKFTLYDGEYAITKTVLSTKEKAHEILGDIKDKNFAVADVVQKEMRRLPQPPYTTSTLQQDASRRLGLNAKRTMSLAQKLYEEGYITYHRTDSVNMAKSAQVAIAEYVKKEFGERYLPKTMRVYSTKQKLAQEAHEAIRPTAVGQLSTINHQLSNTLGNQGWKLYEMIWRRSVSSQMSYAIIESTAVLVDSVIASETKQSQKEIAASHSVSSVQAQAPRNDAKYRFKANGSVLVFDGFLRVNPFALSDKKLPVYQVGDKLSALKIESFAHETPPPPRYNDASLIKTLEEKGIGRPSTYASIISTIETRKYIDRGDPVTGTGRAFVPTAIGNAVTDFLIANFPEVDDIPFTAQMEDMLDDVASGKKEWIPEIKKFYTPFAKKFESVKEKGKRVKIQVEELGEKCPECGEGLVIRVGKFGKFISCSTFPECKYSKQYVEKTGKNCPKCGALPDGKHGEIIVRKTRKGRVFYGCSNYPNC
ncbi:MAG: DNA topoisomerase, partial [Patescibacteria group bacterium]